MSEFKEKKPILSQVLCYTRSWNIRPTSSSVLVSTVQAVEFTIKQDYSYQGQTKLCTLHTNACMIAE